MGGSRFWSKEKKEDVTILPRERMIRDETSRKREPPGRIDAKNHSCSRQFDPSFLRPWTFDFLVVPFVVRTRGSRVKLREILKGWGVMI